MYFSAKGSFPKPAIANMSETHVFFDRESQTVWSLGEWDYGNQSNDSSFLVGYRLGEGIFNCQKEKIPEFVLLGTQNFTAYDYKSKVLYVVSGMKFDNLVEHKTLEICNDIYVYNIQSKLWSKIFTLPKGVIVKNLDIDVERKKLLLLVSVKGSKSLHLYCFGINAGIFEHYTSLPMRSVAGCSFNLAHDDIYILGGLAADNKCYNEFCLIPRYFSGKIKPHISSTSGVEFKTFIFSVYLKKESAIIYIGGTPDGYVPSESAYIYYIKENSWYLMKNLFPPEWRGITTFAFDYEKKKLYAIDLFNFCEKKSKYFYANKGIFTFDIDLESKSRCKV